MDVISSRMLEGLSYWPRANTYEARILEQSMAGPTLFDPGISLEGAVVEAIFAASDPPLLERFREASVPFIIDPQTLRFHSPHFLEIEALRGLPYAPDGPLTPSVDLRTLVARALAFQQRAGASCYMVPGVWAPDPEGEWVEMALAVHRAAAAANGIEVDRHPLVAYVAPGWATLKSPDRLLRPLADLPVDAVYVQPLRLAPTRDGVEKLVWYSRFLSAAGESGLPVIAGRVGAFGLILQALGVGFFDSGLGEGESFDLSHANRPRRRNPQARDGGGRRRRVYLERLKTTLEAKDVEAIFGEQGLRTRFACTLPCCESKGFEGLADRRRQHYLRVRTSEVGALRRSPTGPMRLHEVHNDLVTARDHADVVRRALLARDVPVPSFDHLDRWLAVLSRVAGVSVAA
jgi:hypothetical protein